MPSVFFSYCHADEALRDQLEKQLSMLKRQGVIDTWHDRRIGAGQELDAAIDNHINSDEIILLLVSPDFIASDYCYNVEMARAMERHAAKEAIVIPVILRACDWHHAPFGKLLATPEDGKPVTLWPDRDVAFLQVAQAVRKAVERCRKDVPIPASQIPRSAPAIPQPPSPLPATGPRSSNLRVAKSFTQRDKDQFLLDTFEYIARYFENSLQELQARNPGYEGVYRRIDANRFSAVIYKDGRDVARGTVFTGGQLGAGIYYSQGDSFAGNSYNESLSVNADDQALYLKTLGMSHYAGHDQKLSQEGAAEALWSIVITPLQRGR
ncbi:toll/interleukin-1 receptor domain-containing protein [Pseudomonas fluorescens]|uniref:toll/interleukin-1 receptor domain-containing protein n=2 Tax=Pseudomonas fluorescens TaxID=294 RepID=UPI00178542D8|nr:toll/interleukin-1 receptor domain-containing protein [Pseudomonas fluorescens]MBD8146754.1 toll/interleukin-1 receptor domain-containing protein [Pseudomonas fluorescens]MBD8175198.1 toll/interleukin-1 receptor domain-containing protein [Pseudomonas fluorescens]MBD8743654.1 toll/interleukin-1 receptor domain-containing protein [Pseudomonas fluorescens]MBD8759546.1 toll/interleukin-1 receptor domain-containing protein [Pseudomonas fluorescens]MBD8763806.1 toll/interleukin-1 receptor domain-